MAKINQTSYNNLTATQILAIENGQISKEGIIEVINSLCKYKDAENYVLAIIGQYFPEIPKHNQCVNDEGTIYILDSYDKFDQKVVATFTKDNIEFYDNFTIEEWNEMIPINDDNESIQTINNS